MADTTNNGFLVARAATYAKIDVSSRDRDITIKLDGERGAEGAV